MGVQEKAEKDIHIPDAFYFAVESILGGINLLLDPPIRSFQAFQTWTRNRPPELFLDQAIVRVSSAHLQWAGDILNPYLLLRDGRDQLSKLVDGDHFL
jgi:hypothetical protein